MGNRVLSPAGLGRGLEQILPAESETPEGFQVEAEISERSIWVGAPEKASQGVRPRGRAW